MSSPLTQISIDDLATRFAQDTFLMQGTKEEESYAVLSEIKKRGKETEFARKLQTTYQKKVEEILVDEFSGTELEIAQDIWKTEKPQNLSNCWNRTVGFFIKGPETLLESFRDHPIIVGTATVVIGIPLFWGAAVGSFPILVGGAILAGGLTLLGIGQTIYHEVKAAYTEDPLEKYIQQIESGKGLFNIILGGLGLWGGIRGALTASAKASEAAAEAAENAKLLAEIAAQAPSAERTQPIGTAGEAVTETVAPLGKNALDPSLIEREALPSENGPVSSAPSSLVELNESEDAITSAAELFQKLGNEWLKYVVVRSKSGKEVIRLFSKDLKHADHIQQGEEIIGAGTIKANGTGGVTIRGNSGGFPTQLESAEMNPLEGNPGIRIADDAGLNRVARVLKELLGVEQIKIMEY